ncbi:MAG TPA: helix-turn-helix transcriptional regulator, partial [Pusillimonas sp.]|uniref:helix-turn-helix transcriptional regulator n=1 Tax=Pusillimonas sp. TaxID=3040095 RepID=UPI002BCAA8B0
EQVAHPSATSGLKIRLAEAALMRHLLCAQSLSLHERHLGLEAEQAPRRLQRAREYIEAHLQDDICLADIAQYSGTSERSLSRMCRLQYGTSPMQLLRELRLDRIRLELANPRADAQVSEVAMRWGYTHLGRFAAAYRQRFGEAPSQTLEASRARHRQARPESSRRLMAPSPRA